MKYNYLLIALLNTALALQCANQVSIQQLQQATWDKVVLHLLPHIVPNVTATSFSQLESGNNYPSSLNINFGNPSGQGFAFFGCPWSNCGNVISSQQSGIDWDTVNWADGIALLLLALDIKNNIILDLTKTNPASCIMLCYDTITFQYIGTVNLPLNSMVTRPSTWQNQSAIGISSGPGYQITFGYPGAVVVTGPTNGPLGSTPLNIFDLQNISWKQAQALLPAIINNTANTSFSQLSSQGNYPDFLNLNLANPNNQGFSFFGCAWNNCSNKVITANEKGFNNTAIPWNDLAFNWQDGIAFLPVALYGNQYSPEGKEVNIIHDVTSTGIDQFALVLYDAKTLAYIGGIYLSLDNLVGGLSLQYQNQSAIGISSGPSSQVTFGYPGAVIVTGPQSSVGSQQSTTPQLQTITLSTTNTLTYQALCQTLNGTPTQTTFIAPANKRGAPKKGFSLNIGGDQGVAFSVIANAWSPNSSVSVQAGMLARITQAQWNAGVQFIMLAANNKGNIFTSLPTNSTGINNFVMYVFDSFGNPIPGVNNPITVPLNTGYPLAANVTLQSLITPNVLSVSLSGFKMGTTSDYPINLTIKTSTTITQPQALL